MTFRSRWWVLSIIPLIGMLSGCQLLAPFYLAAIMMGYDTRVDPPFPLPEDAQRVVVITYCDLDQQIEMGHFDQELNEAVSLALVKGFDHRDPPDILLGRNKVKPQIIKASVVARWQDEHPDWTSYEPAEIGRALKADYVIYLEADNISMYEDGPSKILYRGQADVAVKVVRVETEEVVYPEDVITVQFPKDRPIPVGPEIPPLKFRREFIRTIAARVTWTFLPHHKPDEVDDDPF